MSLYKLTEEFVQVQQQLEDMELDQETLADTLDSLKAPLEEKVENIVKYMKSLEALAEAKKAEAKRLQESAAGDLKKVEWFKQYIHANLTNANIKELQAGVFKIGFRKGSEVVKIDESKIPSFEERADLYEEVINLKGKKELKEFIKMGIEIPGVEIIRNPDSLVVK